MTILTTTVPSLLLACFVGVGPVFLLAILLNRRDRRARALLHLVASQIPAEAMRSDVAVDVRCRLVTHGATVRVDLGGASWPRVWETVARVRRALPPWVRLEVNGDVDAPPSVLRSLRITVESPASEILRRAA